MNPKMQSTDPDIRGSLPALRRAAKAAMKLAKETGTPLYVVKKGRLVNLNPVPAGRAARRVALPTKA
jgi:hypothetical protein